MTVPRFVDLSQVSVVDGHCHPLLPNPWTASAAEFLEIVSEGRPGTMTQHIPHTGFFRRALHDLARRLDTVSTLETVLERRQALGPGAARLALEQSRVAVLLVDTGYPPTAMSLAEMGRLLPCGVHQIFRIETCAQDLLRKGLSYDGFIEAFRGELRAAAQRSVALKSIIAYRSGLAVREWAPEASALAYREAMIRVESGGSPRLSEKPLLDTLLAIALETCRDTGRPLQLHAGFGDPDIDLVGANPLLLRPILENPRWREVRLVLLHLAYPYFREAAFMASVWPQVYVDLSLALPLLGPGAVPPLVEVVSLAPASKLLYGSDVRGLPEFYALAADWARAVLGEALAWLIERTGLTGPEARAIGTQVLADNAVALYGIDAPRPTHP
jgi:uncharacterized protein